MTLPDGVSMAPVATVECIRPADDAAWRALLAHPTAGLFHSPPWLKVLSDAYGLEIRAYVARDAAGVPLGGVPFCEVEDIIGHRIVALPFTDACDPLVPSQDIWTELFAQLRSHCVPVHLRCLDNRTIQGGHEMQMAKKARWHSLAVTLPPDQMWANLSAATRRAIRKAKRSGVEVRPLDRREGCEGFHKLHVALRKSKYRLLAQPPAFFDAVADRFSASHAWFPLGAFVADRLIAATVYLRWGDTLYYKFSASDQEALAVRPNNLLVWAGIELAQSLGCRTLDLGPSDDDQPGLIRFKRSFGAAERELQFLRWTPPGCRDDRGTRIRRELAEMVNLLTAPEVSDEITSLAGACCYRFFA